MTTTHAILSAVAANRKTFFELVEQLEQAAGCSVDESILAGVIDAEYDDRDKLTAKEAQRVLLLCAYQPRGARRS